MQIILRVEAGWSNRLSIHKLKKGALLTAEPDNLMISRNSPPDCPAAAVRLFYPAPPVRSDAIDIVGLGCREWMGPGWIHRPHGTDDWLLMAFEAAMAMQVDGTMQQIETPCLIIWQPGSPHRYGYEHGSWRHSWMHLTGRATEALIRSSGLPLDRPLMAVDRHEIERCVLEMHAEATDPDPDAQIVESLLRIVLCRSKRRALPRQSVSTGLLAARRTIETRYTDSVGLTELATIAGLTPNHFCTAFRRAFGMAPYDFLIGLRLEHARILLRDPDRSIRAVAAAVGYDDPASFARLVRRRWGCTPGALRR
jgi:AraC-like DNA-binding protein